MRKPMIVLLALLVVALFGSHVVRSAVLASNSQSSVGKPASCRYEVAATLNAALTTLSAVTQVSYRNSGPDALEELVFHFEPTEDAQGADSTSPTVLYLSGDSMGQPLRISRFSSDGRSIKDHFVVRLPKPVKLGESVRLQTTSQCRVGDRYGMKNVEGSWHPRILHRAKGIWQDGRDAFADYRVTVGPLAPALIPVSGRVLEQKKDDAGRWTITSEATNIPDFAMVFSKADLHVSGSQDGVTIHCFYEGQTDKEAAQRMLATAKNVIGFYRGLYGFYPDQVLNIIVFDGNGYGGGPFGSNIIHVNNTFDRSEDNTMWAVAHEIAHMYWGWNRIVDARPGSSWLCLGMGLWTDRQYMDAKRKEGQHENILYEYTKAAKKGLNTKLLGVTPADRKNRLDENPLAHGKGYQIILELEYLFGTDAVRTIAQKTLERYARQPVDAEEFQAVCKEVTGQDLEWFFHEWLYTSDRIDYALKDVNSTASEGGQQFTVSVEPKGGIVMPVDVMLEYEDGSCEMHRLERNQREATFASAKTWRRAIVDPKNLLPDTNRSDNIRTNPAVPPVFEILDVDLGDKAWGLNCLKVHVCNRTSRQRTLFVHIGGQVEKHRGFGMGHAHTLDANEEKWVEHWYWVPPYHGTGTFKVSFTDATGGPRPQDDPPFLQKAYSVTIPLPNDRCNDLMITDKIPDFGKDFPALYPADMRRIEPFKYVQTPHFVFYYSPDTPAAKDMAVLAKEHEAALASVCEFLGKKAPKTIVVFFYPDRQTKRMVTYHEGDGMASGTTIAQVYNEKTHLDPFHEVTHVVAGQVGDPPGMFNEGLAVWMQKNHIWEGEAVDVLGEKGPSERAARPAGQNARTRGDRCPKRRWPDRLSAVSFVRWVSHRNVWQGEVPESVRYSEEWRRCRQR